MRNSSYPESVSGAVYCNAYVRTATSTTKYQELRLGGARRFSHKEAVLQVGACNSCHQIG